MRKIGILVLLVALVAGVAASQTTIYGPGTTRAFNVADTGAQAIVRDSNANLYVIYRYAVNTLTQWDLAIAKSSDDGKTWNMTWQTGFAQLGTDFGNYNPCIAIDGNDNLHCAWFHRVAFSGSRLPRTTCYNRYVMGGTTPGWGTEASLHSAYYAVNSARLAVDKSNFVWFIHSTNSGSWDSRLYRSTKPYADGATFSLFSPSPFVGSYSQHTAIAIDANDYVHVTYYDTATYAGVRHQWCDPAATTPAWTYTALSNHGATNTPARAEYRSYLSADYNGNVFAIYGVDEQAPTSSRNGNTEHYIRKWDGSMKAWGKPVMLQSIPSTIWNTTSGCNNPTIFSGCCDEGSGTFYFIYRNLLTGNLVLGNWNGDDTEAPATLAHLANTGTYPANSLNYLYSPKMRGSLYPVQNRTVWGLHAMYVTGDQVTAKTYTDYFESFSIGSLSSTGTPKVGTTYKLDLGALQDGGNSYTTALCVSGYGTAIQIGRRFVPLLPDTFFYITLGNSIPSVFQNFSGVLSATGTAQAGLAIPSAPVLVGIKAYTEFVTYPGGVIKTISNPFSFTLVP